MAIQRYQQKPKIFTFDGMEVGLRRPNTDEMVQITRKRAEYIKTVKAEILAERKNETGIPMEGDAALLFELHKFVSELLCCDPENVKIPWFAPNPEEGERLGKDTVEDVPQAFHTAAFEAFVTQDNELAQAAAEKTGVENAGADADGKVIPLRPTTDTVNQTTSGSVETSSPSANGSAESTPISTLDDGTTATS